MLRLHAILPAAHRRAVGLVMLGLVAAVVTIAPLQAGTAGQPVDAGYRDFAYPAGTGYNDEVTGEKPESKLWHNDGHWWAVMWSTAGNAYHIYRLDMASQDWVDTETPIDPRSATRADALWDGTKLYIVSHIFVVNNGQPAPPGERGQLYRYSYDTATDSYTLDAGFPVEVTLGKSETLVVAKDGQGTLWVTYVESQSVMVNHSIGGDDAQWGTPYVLPVTEAQNLDLDDISSVATFEGRVGIMWSNQAVTPKKMYFASHEEGADDQAWSATAAYGESGDDHINLKTLQSDEAGRLFAVVKTSRDSALIIVLKCSTGGCASTADWGGAVVYDATAGSPTRPVLLIDTTNRDLHVFARVVDAEDHAGIYHKTSDLDVIAFPGGLGTPFILSAQDPEVNDPTTTKQSVDGDTDLVILASDQTTQHYLHNVLDLAGTAIGTPTPTDTAVPTSTPTATGSPTQTSTPSSTPIVAATSAPTNTAAPTNPPAPTPVPPGGLPMPPIAYEPAARAQAGLPVLNYLGNDEVCDAWIEVQNIGSDFTAVSLVIWGEPGFCPPQAAGPLKVECTGILKPGSTWNLLGSQLPYGGKSAVLYSFSVKQLSDVGLDKILGFDDVIADFFCESLFFGVIGSAGDYRRFRLAYNERLRYAGIPMELAIGQPIAAEVLRRCGDPDSPGVITSKYEAISGTRLGIFDPVYGGFGVYAPLLYAGVGGMESVMYVQNLGADCSTVEIWFQQQDNCIRPYICEVFTLAPGETFQYLASDCVGPSWTGSAWLRTSQPVGMIIDHIGPSLLLTYTASQAQLRYSFDGPILYTQGTTVAYGPLVYSEYQGWDTGIQVQNLSPLNNAKVKVYFLDRSGDIITTLVDWICPRGSQTFFLPSVADLPGNWVGSVRVESQTWALPHGPIIGPTPITGVAHLIRYADIQHLGTSQGLAYNLLNEYDAYDWQLGCCEGGLQSGVGLLAVPSLLKDLDGTGVSSELAIANFVPKPGFTDFAIYIYDQNGLVDYVCEKLHEKQVEYIDLATWGYVHQGFKGSAIISAVFWEHDVFSPTGEFLRNVVGLGAVTIERTGTLLQLDVPGDEAAGSLAIPIHHPFMFMGLAAPECPGLENASPLPDCPEEIIRTSGNLGLPVPDGGSAASTIAVRVPRGCLVTDVNVSLAIANRNNGDLKADLTLNGVDGLTTRTLFANICVNTMNIVTTLDDDAGSVIGSICPPIGGRYTTQGRLDAFDGQLAAGDWTLRVSDLGTNFVSGELIDWTLNLRTQRAP
jgi:hypothetical protein